MEKLTFSEILGYNNPTLKTRTYLKEKIRYVSINHLTKRYIDIEFKALESLRIEGNSYRVKRYLKNFKFKESKKLKYLYISSGIINIDISNNIELEYVYLKGMVINPIDLSKNKNIIYLYIECSTITNQIKFPENIKDITIICNIYINLDFSNCKNLENINIKCKYLYERINFSGCKSLKYFKIEYFNKEK